jgi:wyosine [tRNA(Phe)-imidazoG37] synthetase (radical SAM superfamily)
MGSGLQLKTVYGPVRSWRYGWSLGIDLIVNKSVCSFNCVYCQLGNIQEMTLAPREFVPTGQVISDLEQVDWSKVDIVTISGNGEPTLATNIGQVIGHIKETYHKPVMILTNATLLNDPEVRKRILGADIIDCKLDAASDEMLKKFNRPVEGVTVKGIIEGIKALRREYTGKIHLQCMFMPVNVGQAEELAGLIEDIRPDLVQLNTPRRPYPKQWEPILRGDHERQSRAPAVDLKTVDPETAMKVERILNRTGIPIQSVYKS